MSNNKATPEEIDLTAVSVDVDNLSVKEANVLKKLANSYAYVFACDDDFLRRTSVVTDNIDLNENSRPWKLSSWRFLLNFQREADK